MNDELDGKIMAKFVGFRAKTYIVDGSWDKKVTNAIKRKLKFENYKNCLKATQLDNRMNHLEEMKLTQVVLK